jgi:hypothetical protein
MKYIIISSHDYPSYGGCATIVYKLLIHIIQNYKDTIKVIALFYSKDIKANFDPENTNSTLNIPFYYNVPDDYKKMIIEKMGSYPEIIISYNPLSGNNNQELFPDAKHIYMLGGIHYSELCFPDKNITAMKCIMAKKNKNAIKILNDMVMPYFVRDEIAILEKSSSIIVNSNMTKEIFEIFYEKYYSKVKKPLNLEYCLSHKNNLIHSKYEKIYDICFITTDFVKRKVKNPNFVVNLFSNEKMEKYNKIVAGNNSDIFSSIQNVSTNEILPHDKILEILLKSKITLIPSFCDSNPNVLYEAINCDTIVLTTLNVGNSDKLPKFSLCDSFKIDEWIEKIEYIIKNYENLIPEYKDIFKHFENDINYFIEHILL